jgi:hypothetical protein
MSASVYSILGAFSSPPDSAVGDRAGTASPGGCWSHVDLPQRSGPWMTLFHAMPYGGDLLVVFRLVIGSAMAGSIVLSFAAVRRRDLVRHRAWMIRGYAFALGRRQRHGHDSARPARRADGHRPAGDRLRHLGGPRMTSPAGAVVNTPIAPSAQIAGEIAGGCWSSDARTGSAVLVMQSGLPGAAERYNFRNRQTAQTSTLEHYSGSAEGPTLRRRQV